MDYDKLIEALRNNKREDNCHDCALGYYAFEAATAIETLCADLACVTVERDLAIEYVRGQCKYCKHNFVCTSRKGSHKYCWEWLGRDKEDLP